MNSPNETLESMIADETAYHGPQTQLWAAALEQERGSASTAQNRPARRVLHAGWLALAATACAGVVVVAMILPNLGRARARSPVAAQAPAIEMAPMERSMPETTPAAPGGMGFAGDASPGQVAPATAEPVVQDRHVIRKATMDLVTSDVRGTYAKIALFINEGAGEFIEGASLSGDGADASAQITLRVTAQRMGEVMLKLGSLARVNAQQTFGEDVTDRVIDLQARLRNEQRVEAELLDLLAARKDAPLKEVLELRDQISRVRGEIERLTAQRDTLGRLTSLASIAVTIHAEPRTEPSPKSSRWETFGKQLSLAWGRGMDALSGSLIGLVEIAVGGLLGWLALAAVIVGVRFAWVAASRQDAKEPAPRI